MQEYIKILSESKVDFMLRKRTAFYSTILLSLKLEWSIQIDTASVFKTSILINPAFFMSLSREERQFLLFHETSHIALNHLNRKGNRDHIVWNSACDYAINLCALDNGFHLIDGSLINEDYRGLSAEEIYALLINKKEKIINPFLDLNTEGITKKDEEEIKSLLVKAYTVAKSNSELDSIPTELTDSIEELIHPKLDYKAILSNYCFERVNEEYSLAKRNRRFPKMILPSLHSYGLQNITFAVDSSTSVTDKEFDKALNDISFIRDILQPESLRVISFTTRIVFNKLFYEHDDISSISFKARGGTNIQCVFNLNIQTDLLIVFSDMYLSMPANIPNFEVLWICVNNPEGRASFGKVIHTEI